MNAELLVTLIQGGMRVLVTLEPASYCDDNPDFVLFGSTEEH